MNKNMKKIILKSISTIFTFVSILSISNFAKADTFANIAIQKPTGTRYSGFIYTVTFQTDKPSYNPGDIVVPILYYSSTVAQPSTIMDATNMTLNQTNSSGPELFSLPLMSSFVIPANTTPGPYFLYAILPEKFKTNTPSGLFVKTNNNFNLISFLSDTFIPKKAEACWMEITTCDEFGNCVTGPTPTCNFGSGGISGGSGGPNGFAVLVSTTFNINNDTPKIFSR